MSDLSVVFSFLSRVPDDLLGDLFLNPVFYVAVQAVCFGFVFFCDAVLNNPYVNPCDNGGCGGG
jgi:hypothetical protein